MHDFDLMAAGWDTPQRSERARKIADFIIRKLPESGSKYSLADIGSGTGVFGLSFLSIASAITFVDTSRGMLDELKTKIETNGIEGCELVLHDISSGPMPKMSFDLVVSMMAFHHIEDHRNALKSIAAMLAPGGTACIVDLDREDGSFHGGPEGVPHLGFDRDELAAAASDAGFSRIEFDTPYVIEKETADGPKRFPLFLMTARR